MRRVAVLIASMAACLSGFAVPGGSVVAAAPAATAPASAAPAATAPASAAPAVPYGSITFAQARQAMARVPAKVRYADWLVANAEALPAAEASSLLAEFTPKAPEADRPALFARAGSLNLVAGRYRDAARAFEGSGLPEWRVMAARCRIAAGEFKAARSIAATIAAPVVGESPQTAAEKAAQAAVLRAWAALLEGAPDNAWTEASAALTAGKALRREALFLQWIAASSPDSALSMVLTDLQAPGDPSIPGKRLTAEFPGSAEAALVSGKIQPQPVAWLVLGAFPQAEKAPGTGTAKSAKSAKSAQLPKAEEASGSGDKTSTLLQAGWFSRRENADALAAGLKKKGFSARVETQKTSTGETRWAVLVEPEGDWTKTQARLKDSGYESYPTD